jgi:hypothetical protein
MAGEPPGAIAPQSNVSTFRDIINPTSLSSASGDPYDNQIGIVVDEAVTYTGGHGQKNDVHGLKSVLDTSWFAAVAERDIDMLLLEEIHVSEPFRNWLAIRLLPDGAKKIEFLGAWHSVYDAKLGQTDLLFVFRDATGRKCACFLEDKIDAFFTNEQAERYRVRRDRSLASKQSDVAVTCLVAPRRYIDSHPADAAIFDLTVSYEEIRDRIGQGIDVRSKYKVRFLQEAIDQNRRGYVPSPNEAVTEFWKSYWHMAIQRAPQLKMKPPTRDKPTSSGFFYFTDCLPKGVKIVHKTRFDAVDLQFSGTDVGHLASRIAHVVEDRMMLVRAKNSAAVRIKVPHVVLTDPFEPQAKAVEQALDAAAQLLIFFEDKSRFLVVR